LAQNCVEAVQGIHELLWRAGGHSPIRNGRLFAAALTALSAAALPVASLAACPGPEVEVRRWGDDLWWLPGSPGDATAANRGQVVNAIAVRQGDTLWLIGSGPSPIVGAAIACRLLAVTGLAVTDVVAPWARPEAVLGNRAFAGATLWALSEVAAAMRQRCVRCIARLQSRLGEAAADVSDSAIVIPDHLLVGESGTVGPLRWWRLTRDSDQVVTVFRLLDRPYWFAPGLLWSASPPDGRDADIVTMGKSTQALLNLAAADGASAHWLGEQGPPASADLTQRHVDYWAALLAAVDRSVERGDNETAPPPAQAGLPPEWSSHPWHGFNWQRAWRQSEDRLLGAPAGK
jgi:hypothetical protein